MNISCRDVAKSFGDITAIEDISFEIDSGEMVFITGRSGVGKSTILKLILGEYLPSEGEVNIGGRDITTASRKEILDLRRRMGVIYQDYRLLGQKTVEENILVALDVVGKNIDNYEDRLGQVLSQVGLEDRRKMFPAQLSGGELQRTCLARSLIVEPDIILADEPTGNLDPQSSWELIQLLKEINRNNKTVIMATHDFDIVNSLNHRVIKLDKGKIVSDQEQANYD